MWYPLAKRGLDVIVAGVALVLLAPLFLVVMVILRFTGEEEVFYRQTRIGHGNRPFQIWKFATMLKASPTLGTGLITLRDDPRVMPFGRFLRSTKINELPQIINILTGDMSLVGPRPLAEKQFLAYPEKVRERINDVSPGLTGIGSIVFRDEERQLSEHPEDPHGFYAREIAPYKGALELWYQERRSLTVDLVLIFLTAWVIMQPTSQLVHRVFRDLPLRRTG